MNSAVTIQLREFLEEKFRPVYDGLGEIKEQLRTQNAAMTDIDRRVTRLEERQSDLQKEMTDQRAARQKLLWWVVSLAIGVGGWLLLQFIDALR